MEESPAPPAVAEAPIFPEWLLRIDPTLRGAGDNAPFAAFCLRGLALEPSPRSIRRLRCMGHVNLAVIVVALGSLPVLLLLTQGAGVLIYIALMLAFNASRSLKRRIRVKTEKNSLAETTLLGRRATREMTDLWMSGVRGGEILLGVYTEYAALIWRCMLVLPLLFATGLGIFLWLVTGWLGLKLLSVLLLGWFLYEATNSLYISQMRYLAQNAMMPLLRIWSPNVVMELATSRLARSIVGLVAVGCLLFGLMMIFLTGARMANNASTASLQFVYANSNILLLDAVLLAWAAGLRLTRDRIRAANINYVRDIAARGDKAFDDFMREIFERGARV